MTMRDAADELSGPSLRIDVGLRRALDILLLPAPQRPFSAPRHADRGACDMDRKRKTDPVLAVSSWTTWTSVPDVQISQIQTGLRQPGMSAHGRRRRPSDSGSVASLPPASWTSCRNSGTFCGAICRWWGRGPSRLRSPTASATASRRFTSTSPAFLDRVRSCFGMKASFIPTTSPRWTSIEVLFPAKAEIDLAYFSRRTLVSDLGWILRGVWMIATG